MTNAFRWSLLSDFYFTLKDSNQRQALAAGGGLGGKMPKGEPAFGAESPGAGQRPRPSACTQCWAVFALQSLYPKV
jgi:hypothetical protein